MDKNQFKVVVGLLVVIAVIGVYGLFHKAPLTFGSVPSTATTYNDLNLDSTNGIGGASIYVNGIKVLASSTTIGFDAIFGTFSATTINATTSVTSPSGVFTTSATIGGGTPITKIVCGSLATSTGAIATGATSTITNFTLTGATTTQKQAYSFGYASTTSGLVGTVNPQATTGQVTITLYNGGLGAWGGATTTYVACYTQF